MHSFYLPPSNLDLLAISGPDAVKLLQGQLTCDVEALPDPGFTRGALCNNKGRVLATFILVRQGATFYLALNKGLGDVVAAALKKYLPFYKCEFRQLPTADHACFGANGDTTIAALGLPTDSLPESGHCANLAQGWICTLDQAQQQYLVYDRNSAPLPGSAAVGTLTDWLISGMQSGQFPFLPEDAEKYTPQEVSLDVHDYVSFTKGCYTGQEIVARMHYRGKLKKRLYLLQASTTADVALLPSGGPLELRDNSGQVLGETLKILYDHSGSVFALATLRADMEPATRIESVNGLQFDLRPF